MNENPCEMECCAISKRGALAAIVIAIAAMSAHLRALIRRRPQAVAVILALLSTIAAIRLLRVTSKTHLSSSSPVAPADGRPSVKKVEHALHPSVAAQVQIKVPSNPVRNRGIAPATLSSRRPGSPRACHHVQHEQCFAFLELRDHAVAAVCKQWHAAWTRHLEAVGLIRSMPVVTSPLVVEPTAAAILPDGRLCIADASQIAIFSHDRHRVELMVSDAEPPLRLVMHLRSDGATLYTLEKEGRVRRFALSSGKQLRQTGALVTSGHAVPSPPGYVMDLADGTLYVATRHDMCLLDPETLTVQKRVPHSGMPNLRGMVHARRPRRCSCGEAAGVASEGVPSEGAASAAGEAPLCLYVGTWNDGIHLFGVDGILLHIFARPHDTGLSDFGWLQGQLVVLCHREGRDSVDLCHVRDGSTIHTYPMARGLRGASPFRLATGGGNGVIVIFSARRAPSKTTVEVFMQPRAAGKT